MTWTRDECEADRDEMFVQPTKSNYPACKIVLDAQVNIAGTDETGLGRQQPHAREHRSQTHSEAVDVRAASESFAPCEASLAME